MAKSSKDSEIVKAVIGLGSALGKTVIAEGIETPAQLSQLRALGCRYGQGRLLAPPLTVDEVEELLDFMMAENQNRRLRVYDTSMTPLVRH